MVAETCAKTFLDLSKQRVILGALDQPLVPRWKLVCARTRTFVENGVLATFPAPRTSEKMGVLGQLRHSRVDKHLQGTPDMLSTISIEVGDSSESLAKRAQLLRKHKPRSFEPCTPPPTVMDLSGDFFSTW